MKMKTFKKLGHLIRFLQHRGVLKAHIEIGNLIKVTWDIPGSIGSPVYTGNVIVLSGDFPDSAHDWTVKAVQDNGLWRVWDYSKESRDIAEAAGLLD
jgi:hypothetical protein